MNQAGESIEDGARGLVLLFDLNWDRVIYPAAIALALMLGAWLMTAI